MRVATLDILVQAQDNATKALNTISDRVRFVGARLRNAGIGLTIAMAPFSLALNNAIQDAMEYDQISRSIRTVTTSTGRDIGEVMGVIEKHSGQMSSKLDLTRGTLKLLSTDLSNVQIDQFIQLVKDGATAMGEDFGTQMTLVTRGFKQLNPNVIDNIGINVRMKDIYKKVAKEGDAARVMYVNMIAENENLTDAQKDAAIEQTLFTEMQRKGSVYSGIYADSMNTTAGRVAVFRARLSDLNVEVGTVFLPYVSKAVEALTSLLQKFEALPEKTRDNIIKIGGLGIVLGTIAAVVLMFGGNLIWAIGQLAHLGGLLKWFLVVVAPVGILMAGILTIFISWGSVLSGVYTKIELLRASMYEFMANVLYKNGPALVNIVNIFIEFANALIEVNNAMAELKGGIKLAKLERLEFADVTETANKLMDESYAARQRAAEYTEAQRWFNQGGPIPGWAQAINSFLNPQEQVTPTIAPTGLPTSGTTENNMYGNVTINISQPGNEYMTGSTTDIEKIITTLEATVAAMKQGA